MSFTDLKKILPPFQKFTHKFRYISEIHPIFLGRTLIDCTQNMFNNYMNCFSTGCMVSLSKRSRPAVAFLLLSWFLLTLQFPVIWCLQKKKDSIKGVQVTYILPSGMIKTIASNKLFIQTSYFLKNKTLSVLASYNSCKGDCKDNYALVYHKAEWNGSLTLKSHPSETQCYTNIVSVYYPDSI